MDDRITPDDGAYAAERHAFWLEREAACRAVGATLAAETARRWADYWALEPADRPEMVA